MYKAYFSNATGRARLVKVTNGGETSIESFESATELTEYCNRNNIDLTVGDCHTEA